MENIVIGKIKYDLEQHREYKSLAVKYETAKVSRVIEYREKGKDYKNTLSVSIHARTANVVGPLIGYEVNWSAIGSVPASWATAYAELLTEAVKLADRLTAAYVKP